MSSQLRADIQNKHTTYKQSQFTGGHEGESVLENFAVTSRSTCRNSGVLRSCRGSGRPPPSLPCQAENKDGMEGKWPIVRL